MNRLIIKENIFYMDDYIKNIYLFFEEPDLSIFKITLNFFRYIPDDCISILINQLFNFSNNNNNIDLFYKKKTILGFFTISSQMNIFNNILDNIIININKNKSVDNCNIYKTFPNKTNKYITSLLTCLNEKTFSDCIDKKIRKTGAGEFINMIEKSHYYNIILSYIIDKDILNKINLELYKEYFEIIDDDNSYSIEADLIIKLTKFIFYNIFIEPAVSELIRKHYILYIINSNYSINKYNITFTLKSYYNNQNNILFNMFFNKDFKIHNYIMNFKYKNKCFSTCGETTILNTLNYFIINKIDLNKLNKKNLIYDFYVKYDTIYKQTKDFNKTMTDWLDIVSNLPNKNIYGPLGDINPTLQNLTYVFKHLLNSNKNNLLDILNELNKNITINILSNNQILIDNKYNLLSYENHAYIKSSIQDTNISISGIKPVYKIDEVILKNDFYKVCFMIHIAIISKNFDKLNNARTFFKNHNVTFPYLLQLAFYVNMQNLILDYNNIYKIEGLDNLVNLQILNLSNNNIYEIEGLTNLKILFILGLSSNNISKIEGLDNLNNLQILYLDNNNISKIEGLDNLNNLQTLNLSNNNISEIEGLDNLNNLQVLFLQNNRINKIKGLNNLINLQTLNLSSNKINKIEGFDKVINLQNLNIGYNQIKSLTNFDILFIIFNNRISKFVNDCWLITDIINILNNKNNWFYECKTHNILDVVKKNIYININISNEGMLIPIEQMIFLLQNKKIYKLYHLKKDNKLYNYIVSYNTNSICKKNIIPVYNLLFCSNDYYLQILNI